jgi:hypothetical protein
MAAITDLSTASSVAAADYFVISQSGTDKKLAYSTMYASGTFTPYIDFGGAHVGTGASLQQGNWIRVGRLVFVDIVLILTSKGSSTGSVTIVMPTLTAPAANTSSGISVAYCSNLASLTGQIHGNIISGPAIQLFQLGSTGSTALTNSNFTNTTRIDLWGHYTI